MGGDIHSPIKSFIDKKSIGAQKKNHPKVVLMFLGGPGRNRTGAEDA